MDLVKEFYESLRDYFIDNKIKNKKFYQLSSSLKDDSKITFINLGILLNKKASRGENIYDNGIKKVFGNYYRITYAVVFPSECNEELIFAIRLLSELKNIGKDKITLLNSEELFLNPFVNFFIDKFLDSSEYKLNKIVFVEIEFYLESLTSSREIKRVKKVNIKAENV